MRAHEQHLSPTVTPHPRPRDERGSALVEAVLVFPALLLAVMLIVQFALYFHAQSVAEAAAQDAVTQARHTNGTETDARAAGYATLDRLGPRLLTRRDVTVERGTETARATVSATVASLVPGLHLRIAATAAGPVERFIPQGSP
jgi:Flp pilus assembly protein TadG